jgi:hypothetical protein
LWEVVSTANLPVSLIATARGFLLIRNARHVPLNAGRCSVDIRYRAEELNTASHRPVTEMLRPNDSGKAEEVALVDTSSIMVVLEYGLCLLVRFSPPVPYSSAVICPGVIAGAVLALIGVSVISCADMMLVLYGSCKGV